jgi:hypothetical protein
VTQIPAARTAPTDPRALANATPLSRGVRRSLLSATAVFLLAAAFLAGLQLATGTSVTGTNMGIHQEAALPADQPGAGQQARQATPDEVAATDDPGPTSTGPESTTGPSPTETGTPAPTTPEPGVTTDPSVSSPTTGTATAPVTPVPSG